VWIPEVPAFILWRLVLARTLEVCVLWGWNCLEGSFVEFGSQRKEEDFISAYSECYPKHLQILLGFK
jgi:hypothetical protein